MTVEAIMQELLRAVLTLLAGVLIARVGLVYYFRQKEYETVKERYLEQAVDLVASELETISWTFSHNWARSLEILRLYRELPRAEFDPQELKNGFLDLRSTNFQQIAHHRLTDLLRSNVMWDVYQLTLSGYKTLNNKVTIEFVQGIRLHHAGHLNMTHKHFIEESEALLKPLSDEGNRYSNLLFTLQVIAAELEQSKLRLKDIEKFHRRANVIAAIKKLEKKFSEELNEAVT